MKRIAVWMMLLAVVLAGCSSTGPGAQALPTIDLDSAGTVSANPVETGTPTELPVISSEVTASGAVIPVRQAVMASTQGGRVQEVFVQSGDPVTSGKILVRLAGAEKLTAAVEAARMELLAAQMELKDLQENAEQARTAALLRLANAAKALDDAKQVRGFREYRNGSDSMIAAARADLIVATDTLNKAQEAYNYFSKYDDQNLTKAGALSALSSAQKAYDRALANVNYLTAMPDKVEVDLAEAELQAAQSEYDSAQKEYDELQDGLDPDKLALAQQRVKNAEAQLAASLAALNDAEIMAPFNGIVAGLDADPGTWVFPGQTILVLVDLTEFQVKTTDLSERDIPSVHLGQPVIVYVKALGINIDGEVIEISPLAETLGGDVVYATTIKLTEQPEGLLAGMSADVNYLPE